MQAMFPDVHFWDSANAMTAKLGLFFSGSTGEKHWTVPHLKGPCHFVAQTKGYHGIQKHKFNLCIDKKKKK